MASHPHDPFGTFKAIYRCLKSVPGAIERVLALGEQLIAAWFPKRLSDAFTTATSYLADRPLLAFLLFFGLVASRAVHWLSNPQFFIEDGPEFYGPAFNYGLSTLTREYASYFHAVHRILALIATMFPLRYGPLAMELLALCVQAATAALIMSKRLAGQFPSNNVRFSIAFFLIAHPYSDELFGNVAHSQWYLAIISLAIVFAEPCKRLIFRIVDTVVIALNCLTGPYAPIIAGAAWLKVKGDRRVLAIAVVATIATVITIVEILGHPRTGLAKVHRFPLFERMIANQVVSGPVLGLYKIRHTSITIFFDPQMSAIAWFGVLTIVLGLRKSPPFIRGLAALGLFCSLSSLISQATWFGLGNAGMGERYFFYLGMVFMYCVYVGSRGAKFAALRWIYRWLLACSAYAIVTNWVYASPFSRYDYLPQIAKYQHLKTGEKLVVNTPAMRIDSLVKWKTWLIKK